MTVIVAGKNDIAVSVLEYLLKHQIDRIGKRYELGVVCNRTEKGENGFQKSLRFFAEKFCVQEYDLEDIYEIHDLIFLSMEFDRIIKPGKFTSKRLFNIHFSALPKYKGMYTSALPILNGEEYAGVTFHRIDQGIDTGDIIDQELFGIQDKDDCRDLYKKFIFYGTKLVLKNIESVLSDKEITVSQPTCNSTYYSKSAIDYSNLSIDLNQTAEGIRRQVRAFSFREYQLPVVFGKKIVDAKTTGIKSTEKAGTVLVQNEDAILLSTIDYNTILVIDKFGELLKACKEGDLGEVQHICSYTDRYLNAQDCHGWTPLTVAVYNNQKAIVDYLLLRGADIHILNHNGTNLLMYAKDAYLATGDISLVQLFAKLGLSWKEKDYRGKDLKDYIDRDTKITDGQKRTLYHALDNYYTNGGDRKVKSLLYAASSVSEVAA